MVRMRILAIATFLCACVAAATNESFRYHAFFAGMVVGLLLVLIATLFLRRSIE